MFGFPGKKKKKEKKMSRCFPFTPRGSAGKCSASNNDALIDSIKLLREKEKAISNRERDVVVKSSDKKKDRKEKAISDRELEVGKSSGKKKDKKEKKEKKREKKEKKVKSLVDEKHKSVDKLYKDDNCLQDPKGKCSLRNHETEVLERSSLTEEHGRPLDSQNVSCSSDSTSNSSKRKRHLSSPGGIQSQGSIIRIRLSSSHKRDEPSTLGSKEQSVILPVQKKEDPSPSYSTEQPCPNLVRTESSVKLKDVSEVKDLPRSTLTSTSSATLQAVSRKGKEVLLQDKKTECSISGREDVLPQDMILSREPLKKLSSHDKKMQKKIALYNNLFENLVQPMLEDGKDDEDWLFGSRMSEEKPAKRLKSSDDLGCCMDSLPCSSSAVLQPRAHFLSDVGVYALPYTVPF